MAKAPAPTQQNVAVTYFAAPNPTGTLGTEPTGVIGRDDYMNADPLGVWDDQGASAQIVESESQALLQAVQDYVDGQKETTKVFGASQAQEAVSEFLSESPVSLGLINGDLSIVLDGTSGNVEFRPFWSLGTILDEAFAHAREQQTEADLSDALSRLVGPHLRPAAPPSMPAPEPAPAAPVRGSSRARANGATQPAARRRVPTRQQG